ncbi:hypothetical protein SEUCBS140593_009668 [Sporothrix eucalyptigena]|uniref:BZIP domain-containing protein n=1 Tax=Sporothrix eucalyptigena TaxID=1812306 RepID=A0ABP0CYE4_9PEZI
MDYNSQGGGYPAQGNPNSAGYADTSPTYDSSASTYTGYDNTTTATSETCFGNQVDHDQFKGEELTGQLALPEASVTDTGEDLPDYSEHLNLPRVTLTGDAFHFGDNMPDSDPTKYLYDEDFQNQTTWASQLSIGEVRGTYPEEFSNIERFDFTKKNGAPLASFPLMPHGKTYRSGEPGALRTIFNRDDPTEAIPAYHDTVEQRRKEDERRQRLEAKKQKAQRDLDSKRAEIQRKQEQIPRETSPQKLKKLHADLGIQFKHLANLVRKVNSCDEQFCAKLKLNYGQPRAMTDSSYDDQKTVSASASSIAHQAEPATSRTRKNRKFSDLYRYSGADEHQQVAIILRSLNTRLDAR